MSEKPAPQEDQSIPQEQQPAPGKECDTDIETVIDAVKIIKRELLKCDDRFHRASMVVTVMKDLLFNVVNYNLDILGTLKILETELVEAGKHAFFMGTMEQMVKAAKKAEKERDERIAEDLTRLTQ